jgi:hypothetical protein
MGQIHIRDGTGEEARLRTRWDGTVTLELTDGERGRIVASRDSPFAAAELTVSDEQPSSERPMSVERPPWLFWSPAAIAVVVLGLVETGALRSAVPAFAEPLSAALYVLVYLFCLSGTASLIEDAERLRSRGARWQPNPWSYVAGGGAVAFAAIVARYGLDPPIASSLPYLVGAAIVAAVASSALAGPVYLLRRARTVGLD